MLIFEFMYDLVQCDRRYYRYKQIHPTMSLMNHDRRRNVNFFQS